MLHEVRKLVFGFDKAYPEATHSVANRSQGQAETSQIVTGDLNIARRRVVHAVQG